MPLYEGNAVFVVPAQAGIKAMWHSKSGATSNMHPSKWVTARLWYDWLMPKSGD